MTFSTRMKCPLALGLCILVGLSTFSSPALADMKSYQQYAIPYTWSNNAPDSLPAGLVYYPYSYAETEVYTPVNVTDLSYVPISDSSVTVDINGTVSMDRLSSGDQVYIIYQQDPPTGKVRYQLMTLSPSGYVQVPEWSVDEVLGVVPYEDMVIDASVNLPADSGFKPLYVDGADSVITSLDTYPGPFLTWDTPATRLPISFSSFSYTHFPSRVPDPYQTNDNFLIPSGTTIKGSFPIAFQFWPGYIVNDFRFSWRAANNSEGKMFAAVTLGDLYVRNVGTAANPVKEYVYFVNFTVTAIDDIYLDWLFIYPDQPVRYIGTWVNLEIVDSDAAVVSKLQQLLDYYEANPPEADDLKAQSDMQKALEDAAIQDARNSLASSSSAADPDNVLVPATGLTILGAITAWSTVITDFVSAVPWLAVLLAIFVFTTLVSFLIRR